jgi:hypothetical protein
MKQTLMSALVASAVLCAADARGQAPAATTPPPPPPPSVKVGDKAPAFTLPYLVSKPDGGFDRRTASLSDYLGKQNVVLAFFPAAFSPG